MIGRLLRIENEITIAVVDPSLGVDRVRHEPNPDRIEAGGAEQKCLRPLLDRTEQVIQGRYRAIMQEWRGGPDAIQRTRLVAGAGERAIRPLALEGETLRVVLAGLPEPLI